MRRRVIPLIATAIAMASQAGLFLLLSRAPTGLANLRVGAGDALQLRWIEQVVPDDAKASSVARRHRTPTIGPARETPRTHAAVPPQSPVSIPVVNDDRWLPLDTTSAPPAAGAPDAWEAAVPAARPSRDGMFAMGDASVGGRLQRAAQAALCHDLRFLARGSDLQLRQRAVSREVVLRTMRNRGCRL